MFETYTTDQPQWVYPPIGHLGNGPSGITWLSGKTVPLDLQNGFLVTNYRGAPRTPMCFMFLSRTKARAFK